MVKFVCPPTEPEDNLGVGVSTAWMEDCEQYETALVDDSGVHPVQRYDSFDEAVRGHWHWLTHSREISEVTQIGLEGHGYTNAEDQIITLHRKGQGRLH